MRKALAMALGTMLVTGSAAPARAASQIDFSGYFRTVFANEWNQNYGTSQDKTSDSYFVNRLRLNFAFHATDEISVYWRLHAPHANRWGASDEKRGNLNARTMYAFGEVKQDWGKISLGRLSDSFHYFGLASLGWNPGGPDDVFSDWGIFDWGYEHDGLRFANRWDNGFQLVAQFDRLGTDQMTGGDEQTNDLFILQPSYHWDGGGASLGGIFQRDHVSGSADKPALKAFYLNPALAHTWDNGFGVHFEGKFGWGSQEEPGGTKDKSKGYGLYLDLDYNYGPGNVNLAGWWVSGTGENDGNSQSLVDAGDAFVPLIVAYDAAWTRNKGGGAIAAANKSGGLNSGKTNHWAIDFNGRHALSDDLALKYALAYLALNETPAGRAKGIGWEADLGLAANLLDSLEFRSTFGYLFAGEALKEGNESPADSYSWMNTLVFRF